MKKFIMMLLVSMASCMTSAEFTKAERVKDDQAYALIKKCMESKSIDAVSCRFDLASEYAETWAADPEIVSREVVKSHPDYEMAKYTLRVGKLVYHVTIKEPKVNIIGEVLKSGGMVALGILIGVLIAL